VDISAFGSRVDSAPTAGRGDGELLGFRLYNSNLLAICDTTPDTEHPSSRGRERPICASPRQAIGIMYVRVRLSIRTGTLRGRAAAAPILDVGFLLWMACRGVGPGTVLPRLWNSLRPCLRRPSRRRSCSRLSAVCLRSRRSTRPGTALSANSFCGQVPAFLGECSLCCSPRTVLLLTPSSTWSFLTRGAHGFGAARAGS